MSVANCSIFYCSKATRRSLWKTLEIGMSTLGTLLHYEELFLDLMGQLYIKRHLTYLRSSAIVDEGVRDLSGSLKYFTALQVIILDFGG